MVKTKGLQGILIIGLIFIGFQLQAQSNAYSSYQENESRWHYGGSVMANFGRSINVFEVSPTIGYFFFQRRVLTGLSAYYTYYSYENAMETYEYNSKTHYLGAGIYSRFYFRHNTHQFINHMYLHAEYELLRVIDNYKDSDSYTFENDHYFNNVLAGIGFQQQLSGRFSLNFTLLASLMPKDKSPYTNPVFRMGFGF